MRKYLTLLFAMLISATALAGPWPTDDITTTHVDAATDDPSQARAEIYTAMQRTKDIIGARNSASGVAPLDASSLVPLANIPATLTGKSADSVDGIDFSTLTATIAELNTTDVTTPGTAQASKAAVLGADAGITGLGPISVTNSNITPKLTLTGLSGSSSYNFLILGGNNVGNTVGHYFTGSTYAGAEGVNTYIIRNDGGGMNLGHASHPFALNGSTFTINGNTVWHSGNDGSGSTSDADFLDGISSAAFAQLSGATFTGTVGSSKACASGYTRLTPNYCASDTPSSTTSLSRDTCTTITAPAAGAKGIHLKLYTTAISANSAGSRWSRIQWFQSDNTCTTQTYLHTSEGYEFSAVAATTLAIGMETAPMILSTAGANSYVMFSDDAGNSSQGRIVIVGYYD